MSRRECRLAVLIVILSLALPVVSHFSFKSGWSTRKELCGPCRIQLQASR
jgi:hypothetical protein